MSVKQQVFLFMLFVLVAFLLNCHNTTGIPTSFSKQKEHIDSLIQFTIDSRSFAPLSVIPLADSTIRLSQESRYLEGELKGMYNKATGYYYQSQNDKAADWCHFVLEKVKAYPNLDSFQRHNSSGGAYTLLGVLEQRQGKYNDAIQYSLKALREFEAIEHLENIATTYTNISEQFRFIKNFEKALFYNEQAEAYYLKVNRPDRLSTVFQNRGNIFYDQEKYTEALDIFKETLEKAKFHSDSENVVHALNNIGASYEKLGKNEIATQHYITALELYKKRNDYWGEANTLGNISSMYLKTGEVEKAIEFSNIALTISKNHNFLELEKYNTENLAAIYESKGNFEESLTNLKKVIVLNDSLYNQQKFETINLLEQQYSEERANRLIAEKDKTIVKTQLKTQQFKNLATVLSLIFFISLIIAFFLHRQAKFRKEKNQELMNKNIIIQDQNEDLEALVNAYEAQREKDILIGTHQIALDTIIYIRYSDRISSVFLTDNTIIEHRVQLSQLLSELDYKSHFLFSQINQNYIVNFKNIKIDYHENENEKYYFTNYLANDKKEWRTEDLIKTRTRSGLTKKFEREYKRFLRIKELLK